MTTLIARSAGIASSLLGLTVMAGWYLNIPAIVQIRPAYVPMQFNTAAGFLFCGLGLLACTYSRSRAPIVFGSMAALIGAITLLEYAGDIDLGIGQLFTQYHIAEKTVHAGRMSIVSAISHTLSGLAILLLSNLWHFRNKPLLVGLIGSSVAALGIATVFGYLVGLDTPYGYQRSTYMAVHTAIGFVVTGTGILALGWREEVARGFGAPWWISLPVMLGVATFSIIFWQMLVAQELIHIKGTTEKRTHFFVKEINEILETEILALRRMASRWELRGGISKDEWTADAENYVAHLAGLQAVEWVDASSRVPWVVPRLDNEEAQGLNLLTGGERKTVLERARRNGGFRVSRVVDLAHGGKGFLVYVPAYLNDKYSGSIVGVYRVKNLLDPIMQRKFGGEYAVSVHANGEEIYRVNMHKGPSDQFYRHEENLRIAGLAWRIQAHPTTMLLSRSLSRISVIILFVGFVLTLLAGLVARYAQVAGVRTQAMIDLNQGLEDEITARKTVEGVLLKHREQLEDLVAERTREVEDVNETLRGEIDERLEVEQLLRQHSRQQGAVAELGLHAMAFGELQVLMEHAVELVAETLDVPYAKILELLPAENSFLLRAGRGWQFATTGKTRVSADKTIQAGYTLASEGAVVVEDFGTEQRFVAPELLKKHGIVSGVSVPIHSIDKPYGVLGAHTDTARRFTKDDISFMQSIANVLASAIDHKRAETALRNSEARLRQLAIHLETVREEERIHIAREIHDELGQVLTALNMDVHWLAKRFSKDQTLLADKARSMGALINSTIETVQRISSELRPAMLDDLGLEAAIMWYADQFRGRTGTRCDTDIAMDDAGLDRRCATAIFRILQEALTNITRHAQASNVWIQIKEDNGRLVMTVRDDGIGITEADLGRTDAIGLTGMEERALEIGGRLVIEPGAKKGTLVRLDVPHMARVDE